MSGVKLTGDWDRALNGMAGFEQALNRAAHRRLAKEAQGLVTEIKNGIQNQAPGGDPFKPWSKWTVAFHQFPPPGRANDKGKNKILQQSNTLMNSVIAVVNGLKAWVGVKRMTAGGVNIARVHEFGMGPIIIPYTDKMHRMLMAVGSRAGIFAGQVPTGPRKHVLMIRIPARPFLRPAYKVWHKGLADRFKTGIATDMRKWFDNAGRI